jgi:hypothetical protein
VLLTANGLGAFAGSPGIVKKALTSDTSDDSSVAVALSATNAAWLSTAETYDFHHKGLSVLKRESTLDVIANAYAEVKWQEELEAQTPGLSFALSFKDIAATLDTPFKVLGNPVGREVTLAVLGIPPEIAYQPLESQARTISNRLDIAKLKDPDFVETFVKRYLVTKFSSTQGTVA